MKPASRAPMYAAIYHGLAEVARQYGYALAIHGSLQTDLDLIAVPWTDEAGGPQELVEALRNHCEACMGVGGKLPIEEIKPHGRVAWNLYMIAGAKVDLSVLPRSDQHSG